MTTETILLLVLIIFIVGSLPTWPHSKSWGYTPTGIATLILVVFLVWAIAGGRPIFRSSGRDLSSTAQDLGQDIKTASRDAADSVKRAVQ